MKHISWILSIVLLLSFFTLPAMAEMEITPYNSNYFNSYGTTLSRQGDGRIKIVFSADGTQICDEIGVASYLVERLDADGDWTSVSGLLNGKTAADVASYTFSKYFNGVAGETYRVQVTFMCSISSSTEFKNYTSGRITAN